MINVLLGITVFIGWWFLMSLINIWNVAIYMKASPGCAVLIVTMNISLHSPAVVAGSAPHATVKR